MAPERWGECLANRGSNCVCPWGAASVLMGAGLRSGCQGVDDRFFFLIHRTHMVGQEPLTFLHLSVWHLRGYSLAPWDEFSMRERGSQDVNHTRCHHESQNFVVPLEEGVCEPQGCHVDSNSSELCDSWRGCLGLELAAQRPYMAF